MKFLSRLPLTLTFIAVICITLAQGQQGCPVESGESGGSSCSWVPPSFSQTALSDLVGQSYLGTYPGGLYGSAYGNQDPTQHVNDGVAAANRVQPLDINGNPSSSGSIIFLAIGMSNCTIEFCGGNVFYFGIPGQPCASACPNPPTNPPYNETQSFMAQALALGTQLNPHLVLFDGAAAGQTYITWDPYVYLQQWSNYNRVQTALQNVGYSEAQVQVVWLKDTNYGPNCSLNGVYHQPVGVDCTNPSNYDAFIAERYMGDIMRALHARYTHLQQVFISTRIYGGYANSAPQGPVCATPEPFAFEYGISVQRLVLAQIFQAANGGVGNDDPYAGDLDYNPSPPEHIPLASWIDWGPYLWANGDNPRGDGLVRCNDPQGIGPAICKFKEDFRNGDATHLGDYTHPSDQGEQKVGNLLLNFMTTSPMTTPWFLKH